MKKERKIVKINQEEILSIISEYFNNSGDRYVSQQVYATNLRIFGESDKDLHLLCVLSNDEDDCDIFKLNLNEIDAQYAFTGDKSASFNCDKYE